MQPALANPLLRTKSASVTYGAKRAVSDVDLEIEDQSIHALIGPSGCGKSSLLRCFNRMNDFIEDFTLEGSIFYRDVDIYDRSVDPVIVRKRIGMVFQKPNPFPSSIAKNITWGPKINGFRCDFDQLVESSLKRVALWDEVKDRLNESGLALSGGQQQRLCIARAIAMNPDVILMDEPCASLDPISTATIEELILELKKQYCIVIVTHSMQQARRLSDATSFMYQGRLVESGPTEAIFEAPAEDLTASYISGKFG